MRSVLLLLVAFAAVGCHSKTPTGGGQASLQYQSVADRDREALQGDWLVVGIEAAGKPVAAEQVQKIGLHYVFRKDRVTIRRAGRADTGGLIVLDASASPRRMLIHLDPPVRALYALDGDTLRLCLMTDDRANAGYPAGLASTASPKTDLLTLQRQK